MRLAGCPVTPAAGDGVYGLDVSTGKTIWDTKPSQKARKSDWLYETWKFSSPVIWKSAKGRRFILTSEANGLTCRDPANGDKKWSISHRCAGFTTPVVIGDLLVMVSKKGLHCYKLSLQKPKQIWHVKGVYSSERGDVGMPSPLVINDHIFTLDQRAVLTCVNIKLGTVKWSEKIPRGKTWSSPVAGDGKILWIFGDSKLYCLDPTPKQFHPIYVATMSGTKKLKCAVKVRGTHATS